MGYDPRWHREVVRDRLKRSLAARFFLRFHVSLMLLASILGGWGVDALLLKAGWTTMMWRYPIAMVAGYLFFMGTAWLWLQVSGIGEYIRESRAQELVGEKVPPPEPSRPGSDWSDWPAALAYPDGCLVVVVLAVVFFALGGYLFIAAESLFADIVLELLLAAGLIRGLRRLQRSGWLDGLWANTWPSLVFGVVVAFIAGWFAHVSAPKATTLFEAWRGHAAAKRSH